MNNSTATTPEVGRKKCATEGCNGMVRYKGYNPDGSRRYGNLCHHCHHQRKSTGTQNQIDNKKCERCGWDKAPCDRHRIEPAKGYTRENVIILCPNCHRVESLKRETSEPTISEPIPTQSVNMVRGKKQNGIGIGEPGDEMFTLTKRDQHAVVMAHGQGNAEIVSDGEPSLTCNHEAPILAFDTTQVTSKGNYSEPKPGEPCHPLASEAHPPAIAFPARLSGTQRAASEEVSPNLQADNPTAVAFKPSHYTREKDGAPSEQCPPLSADADKGDQDPLVLQAKVAPTLDDRSGRSGANNFATSGGLAIAFKPNQGAKSRSLGESEHLSPTLEAATGGNNKPAVAQAMCVRRLTPMECERLQGLPDGFTEGFSDSVRYRMIGNSVAVPCFFWLAKRIKVQIEGLK